MAKLMAVLAMPGVQLLDVSGPLDVFAEANAQCGEEIYRPAVIATTHGHIRSSSGARLVADYVIGETLPPMDTLLIAGCPHAAEIEPELATLEWLRAVTPDIRRYGSVCSGAFFLAAAGLLDGHRATTHWSVADELAARYPAVTVEKDAIHIADGRLRTAAGVTAGLDLALSLVEEDLGHDLALRVASQLVMFFKRPGGQMQFSRKGEAAPAGRSALQEIQRWITANPAGDHSIAALAERMDLSPRHFARLFRDEVGETPGAWVEAARITAARQLLEQGHAPKQAAAGCGFADIDTFRRAFIRQAGTTPAEYRRHHAKMHGTAR